MYEVIDRNGNIVMQSETNIRYTKEVEKEIIKSGFIIKLDGKKIK